jgi:Zn finger protein HypA/HybF involved in hydrogenase expression
MRATLRFGGKFGQFAARLAGQRRGAVRLGAGKTGALSRRETPRPKTDGSLRQRQRSAPRKAYQSCPNCDSTDIQVAPPNGRAYVLKSYFGLGALLCRDCRHEFQSSIWRWDVVWYARCPHCANLELGDWHEKYYLPPIHERALVLVGANAQRCEACRYNFVSFRPRWSQRETTS